MCARAQKERPTREVLDLLPSYGDVNVGLSSLSHNYLQNMFTPCMSASNVTTSSTRQPKVSGPLNTCCNRIARLSRHVEQHQTKCDYCFHDNGSNSRTSSRLHCSRTRTAQATRCSIPPTHMHTDRACACAYTDHTAAQTYIHHTLQFIPHADSQTGAPSIWQTYCNRGTASLSNLRGARYHFSAKAKGLCPLVSAPMVV